MKTALASIFQTSGIAGATCIENLSGRATAIICVSLRRIASVALLFSALSIFGQERYVILSDRIDAVEQAARGTGGVIQHRLKYLKGIVAELPDHAVAALRNQFGANTILEPDLVYSINRTSIAPQAGKGKPGTPPPPPPQPPQSLPWGIAAVQAPLAWPDYSGAGIIVGVVDTGVQPDHPDLVANIVGGENFVMPPKGKPVIDPNKWADDNGHGTHVAGTIAALDNDIGVVGVAPDAKIFAAKVLNSSGNGYLSAVADGIMSCVANGAQVINLSLGGGDSEILRTAVAAALLEGVTVVAAAGNAGCECPLYPSSYDGVLRISATDSADQLATFSNYGDIDYTAPGVGVLSTTIGSSYATYSGTSMATPHVAGVVALMRSVGVNDLYTLDIGLPTAQQGAGLIQAVAAP